MMRMILVTMIDLIIKLIKRNINDNKFDNKNDYNDNNIDLKYSKYIIIDSNDQKTKKLSVNISDIDMRDTYNDSDNNYNAIVIVCIMINKMVIDSFIVMIIIVIRMK